MKKLAFMFAVLFAAVCFGQTKEEIKIEEAAPPSDRMDEMVIPAEEMPLIADCKTEDNMASSTCTQQKIAEHIAKEVKYPATAKEGGKQGTAYVNFIIKSDGNIADVTIVRGIKDAPELDEEAVRAVKTLDNFDWIPGTQKGKAVSVTYTLPVKFQLQ